MNIDAFIVSVNYSDYLSQTLPFNRKHFDNVIVITDKNDLATSYFATKNNCRVVVTDLFYKDGAKFNKGAAINFAMENLSPRGWVVQLDADIVLPPLSREILEKLDLHEQHLYGIDRIHCPSLSSWKEYLAAPYAQHENGMYVRPGPWTLGTRLMCLKHGGYYPLGFFQMFNVNADSLKGKIHYPNNFPSADLSDAAFSLKWPRTHRHLLPELIGIHLTTYDIIKNRGVNWNGRRSINFGE